MGVQGYSSQRESILEVRHCSWQPCASSTHTCSYIHPLQASYPLTPDTPLSNLASGSNPFSVFYERAEGQQQEEEEEEEEEERSIQIAAQQEHEGQSRRSSESVVEQDDHAQVHTMDTAIAPCVTHYNTLPLD